MLSLSCNVLFLESKGVVRGGWGGAKGAKFAFQVSVKRCVSWRLSNEKLDFETPSELRIPRAKSRELYSVTYMLALRKSKSFNVPLT